MKDTELETLKYPTGKHRYAGPLSPQGVEACLGEIESLPERLKKEVAHLPDEQLDTPYRPGGWTIRQVVHHLCDSHLNGFIRCKLALTENKPTIKPYNEAAWSDMSDEKEMPVEIGLELLAALHRRWLVLLEALTAADRQRIYLHPEYNREFTLDELLSLYAWHGNHHLAQITSLKKRNNWN